MTVSSMRPSMRGERDVLVIIGAGCMGQAVARRIGAGRIVVLGDVDAERVRRVADELADDGYDVIPAHVDVTSRESVAELAEKAAGAGRVVALVHTAGLSPEQASAAAVLSVDLLGVALVLEEFLNVMQPGGAGVVVTSSHYAYVLAKHANHIRVAASATAWGCRGVRINSISPGVISTELGRLELAGQSGDGMRAMIAGAGTGRIGTADDIAAAVEFLLGPTASFITGTDLAVDGGLTAAVRTGTLGTSAAQD